MLIEVKMVKLEIYVPQEFIEKIRDELNKEGFLRIGDYDNVISFQRSEGYWRPLEGSNAYNGKIGIISYGTECKMEVRCLYEDIDKAISIIKAIHPYEEPVIDVIPLLN